VKRIIVIHCSATPPSLDIGVAEIDSWHKARGWSGCGYHTVIRRSGTAEHGRALSKTPAAQRGYNKGTIALCLVGGVDSTGDPEDNFTDDQMIMLKAEIQLLRGELDIVSIVGHRDIPGVNKACPSFDVFDWVYKNIL